MQGTEGVGGIVGKCFQVLLVFNALWAERLGRVKIATRRTLNPTVNLYMTGMKIV